ncbi:MAG: rhodanese-like domain-containing protein [Gammaproteobacteria bacterium]|nr:rhodanese-like domain-containing protein [Gammaproteobacteria bacterium]
MKKSSGFYFITTKYVLMTGGILFSWQSIAAPDIDYLKSSREALVPAQECGTGFGFDRSANLKNMSTTTVSNGKQVLSRPRQCQISYQRVFGVWLQNKATIIDVRLQQEYEKFRIPNSMNLPLYSIKSKAYLKDKLLILVDEGYTHKHLYEACLSLRDQGFKNVKVLDGGLRSWWRYGKLEGDEEAIKDMKILSSNQFETGKNERIWTFIVVDSKVKHPMFLQNEQILLKNNNKRAFKEIDNIMNMANKKEADYGFLVVSRNGDNYSSVQKILKRSGIQNDYYLTGGFSAYESYLKSHHAMLVKSAIGPMQRKKCGSH